MKGQNLRQNVIAATANVAGQFAVSRHGHYVTASDEPTAEAVRAALVAADPALNRRVAVWASPAND